MGLFLAQALFYTFAPPVLPQRAYRRLRRGGREQGDEDLGQTLGRYRLGTSIYINWPIIGPSKVRATVRQGVTSFSTLSITWFPKAGRRTDRRRL